MAKGKRFKVFGKLTETNEWQEAAEYETLAGADAFIRQKLIGVDGVKTARIHDTTGELVDREFNCISTKAAA